MRFPLPTIVAIAAGCWRIAGCLSVGRRFRQSSRPEEFAAELGFPALWATRICRFQFLLHETSLPNRGNLWPSNLSAPIAASRCG